MRHGEARQAEGSFHVDVPQGVEVVLFACLEIDLPPDARVVDQRVQPAEGIERAIEPVGRGRRVCRVEMCDVQTTVTGIGELGGRGFRVTYAYRHSVTLVEQTARDCCADAARRTGYHRYAVSYVEESGISTHVRTTPGRHHHR